MCYNTIKYFRTEMNTKFVETDDDVFSMQVFIPCGGITEADDKKGISHFLEHIKFNKTNSSKKTHKEFNELKKLGATCNAYTTTDHTTFHVNSSSKIWKHVVKLLMQIVFDTNFSENNIKIERRIILEEKALRYEHDNNIKLLDKLYLYEDNPYVSKSVIGTKKSLMTITNNDLREYNDIHYTVNNCVFLISCNKAKRQEIVDYTTKVLKKVKTVKWEQKNKNMIDECIYRRFHFQLQVNINNKLKYNKVLMFFKSFSFTNPNIMYVNMIDHMVQEELMKHLREKSGTIYQIYCDHTPQRFLGVVRISFTTTNDKVSFIIRRILNIIENLAKNEKKFNMLKSNYLQLYDYQSKNNPKFLQGLMKTVIFSRNDVDDSVMLRECIQKCSYEHFKDMLKYIFDANVMSAMIIAKDKSVDYHINALKNSLNLV